MPIADSPFPRARALRTETLRPIGPGFDPRSVLRWPTRALRGGKDGIAVHFEATGAALSLTVLTTETGVVSDEDIAWAIDVGRGLSAVDDDPTEFVSMLTNHPLLGPLARRYDARLRRAPTVFEAFAEAVIAQLVTSDEAESARKRLWAHAGVLIDGTRLRAAPTAEAVRAVPSWKMHEMGVGSRRFVTLHEGAKRGVAIERIAREHAHEPEVFMEKLSSLRGVGPWTVNRVARNALAYADAVPVGDFHAPRVVTEALSEGRVRDGDDAAMLEALAPFRPHRARVVKLIELGWVDRNPALPGTPRRRPNVDKHRRLPWRT